MAGSQIGKSKPEKLQFRKKKHCNFWRFSDQPICFPLLGNFTTNFIAAVAQPFDA
jgi:hypothetical protein